MSAHPLEYLSHSRVTTFRSCPLRFRLAYIDRIKPLFLDPGRALGVAVHAAVEERLARLMADDETTVEELVTIITGSLDEQARDTPIRYGEEEGRDDLIATSRRMLEAWVRWPRPAVKILAVEHEFTVELPDAPWLPPWKGRVDLVELDEQAGFINVIDVKTSRGRYSASDVEERSGQLELYRAAVAPLVGAFGLPIRLGYEVITKARNVSVERQYVDKIVEPIARQLKAATVMMEMIERGLYWPALPGWYCSSCPYRDPHCRDW